MSRLWSSRNLLAAPTVIRMVLDVQKHLKTTNRIIPNSFCFKNCLKKSIPGDVRAQVLQEPAGGCHGDQDGPGCWKHLQMNNRIIFDHFGLINCLKKSIPGDVRAQVLQEPVCKLPW